MAGLITSRAQVLVATAKADLRWAYDVSADDVRAFQNQGFIKLPRVLGVETLNTLGKHLSPLVISQRSRGPYGRAFRYRMHAWLDDEFVREVTFSRRLAAIAADLLGVSALRLSHDHVMYKDPGDGPTPAHADQYHWPISSALALTAWIPLDHVDLNMGPMSFFNGSHRLDQTVRDVIERSDESVLIDALAEYPEVANPYAQGDVSFHLGWTFHKAGPNTTERRRRAFGIVYVEDGARVIQPRGNVPLDALAYWSPGATVGAVLDSPRNPIIYRH